MVRTIAKTVGEKLIELFCNYLHLRICHHCSCFLCHDLNITLLASRKTEVHEEEIFFPVRDAYPQVCHLVDHISNHPDKVCGEICEQWRNKWCSRYLRVCIGKNQVYPCPLSGSGSLFKDQNFSWWLFYSIQLIFRELREYEYMSFYSTVQNGETISFCTCSKHFRSVQIVVLYL